VAVKETLVELAREDARLFQVKQQITNLPRRLQELGRERARLEVQAKEAEGRLQQAESARRKLENELTDTRARKNKSESRLASITSTDQYQAVTKEIETLGARIDALESQVLEAIERGEEAERQRNAERARVEQALGVLTAQARQIESDLEAARAGLEAQMQRRQRSLENVDAATRTIYERILKAKGDAGLALVSAQNCGICNGVQPPQVLQQLRQGTGLYTCQMCGRILVWDPAGG
jgi:predicted  nucleic acid-binding Zn-ribbon protein